MRIMGHKSERMHGRYNTIEPQDLHRAAALVASYHANTVMTPDLAVVGGESVSSDSL